MHVCVCRVCICRSHRHIRSLLYHSLTHLLKTGLSLSLKLTVLAAGPRARIHLSPQHLDFRYVWPCLAFCVVSRHSNSGLLARIANVFTISPALIVFSFSGISDVKECIFHIVICLYQSCVTSLDLRDLKQ